MLCLYEKHPLLLDYCEWCKLRDEGHFLLFYLKGTYLKGTSTKIIDSLQFRMAVRRISDTNISHLMLLVSQDIKREGCAPRGWWVEKDRGIFSNGTRYAQW